MWQTEEWKIFVKVFEMQRTSFDQGRLGHVRRKPTTLGHNFPQLHEVLHEMRGPGVEKVDKWSDERDLEKKMAESRRWAAWAPGLKLMLKVALKEWCAALESPGKIEIQALRADAKEMWKNHVRNDRYPARRDCKTCVRAAGRSKSHRKIQFPEAYTLSIDLSGKMPVGKDQLAGPSARYLVVGVYTFPVTNQGQPIITPWKEEEEIDRELPEADAALPGGDAELPEPGAELPGVDDVLPEEEEPEWHMTSEQQRQERDVAAQSLTFVEVVSDRTVPKVLEAIARIYSRLRRWGCPVYRLHGDKAKELVAHQIHRWATDRGIVVTHTSGDSYKSNGRCEQEVGTVKRMTRIIMRGVDWGEDTKRLWPALARHCGERRLRTQLKKLGVPVASLLPAGQRALAMRKVWQRRYEAWRETREDVQVISVDANSSLTTPGYLVRSIESGLWFTTGDVVVATTPEIEVELQEARERVDLLADEAPRRRIYGKTAPPMISHLVVGGVLGRGDGGSSQEEFGTEFPGEQGDQEERTDQTHLREEDPQSYTHLAEVGTSTARSGEHDPQQQLDQAEGKGSEIRDYTHPRAESPWTHTHLVGPQEEDVRNWRMRSLQVLHGHLTDYIEDEMRLLDVTNPTTAAVLPVLTKMCEERYETEEALEQEHRGLEKEEQEEFLVTRTVGSTEVQQELELWRPAIEKEWKSLIQRLRQ